MAAVEREQVVEEGRIAVLKGGAGAVGVRRGDEKKRRQRDINKGKPKSRNEVKRKTVQEQKGAGIVVK